MKKFRTALYYLIPIILITSLVSCTQTASKPAISIEPAVVDIGGQVIVNGSGFSPNEEVILIADTVIPQRGPAAAVMSLVMADDRGNFSEPVMIPKPFAPQIPPKFAPGQYTVRAMGDRLVAVGSFTVNPGPPGPPSPGAPAH